MVVCLECAVNASSDVVFQTPHDLSFAFALSGTFLDASFGFLIMVH